MEFALTKYAGVKRKSYDGKHKMSRHFRALIGEIKKFLKYN